MQTLTQPTLLLKPFCDSGDKNTIPSVNTDTTNPQRADLTDGFPAITSEAPEDGGLPPERKDLNALGYLTTSYDFFYQAGGTFTFNQTISTAIGGYPLGARLWHTNADGVSMILRSTKQNNTDDFTSDSSYIGTSWVIESMAGMEYNQLSLFDYKFSDKIINKMAWVRSDTNSWLYSSTYSTAYQHLIDDVGFIVKNDSGTVKITVSASGYTSGDYVRSSADDKTIDGIVYYAWAYSTGILYVTLDTSSMSADDAVAALQGQRIYKYENSDMFLTIHKITVETTDSYTIGGSTIILNVLIGSDGHRIVLVNTNENEDVDTIFNGIGVAWYYVLDKTNSRFKLPRTKYNFDGLRSAVGKYISESAPNITGGISGNMKLTRGGAEDDTGALYHTQASNTYQNLSGATFQVITGIYMDASRSCDTYQNNAPLQQRASEMYLYFYLGDFSSTAVQNTAGINAETINEKVDLDFGNVSAENARKLIGNRIWFSDPQDVPTTANQYLNHGLTLDDPKNATAYLYVKFINAVAGYSVGDIVANQLLTKNFYAPSNNTVATAPTSPILDITDTAVVFPRIDVSSMRFYNKNTGAFEAVAPSDIKLIAKIVY